MLDQVDISKASQEQKKVLAKLTKLKELLLNADLELRIKLEQLKRIKKVREQLAELIETRGGDDDDIGPDTRRVVEELRHAEGVDPAIM